MLKLNSVSTMGYSLALLFAWTWSGCGSEGTTTETGDGSGGSLSGSGGAVGMTGGSATGGALTSSGGTSTEPEVCDPALCGECLDSGACRIHASQLWAGSRRNRVQALEFAPDGSFFTISESMASAEAREEPIHGDGSTALMKWDSQGELLWATYWDTDGFDDGRDLEIGPDGMLYVLGGGALGQFDLDGGKQWERTWHETGDFAYRLAVSETHVYVTGWTETAVADQTLLGEDDGFLMQWTLDGTRTWSRHVGGEETDVGRAVTVDAEGNAYISGMVGDTNRGGNAPSGQAFIAKYTVAGEQDWYTEWGSSDYDTANSLVQNGEKLFAAGWTKGELAGAGSTIGDIDLFITEIAFDGTVGNSTQLGSTREDIYIELAATDSGRIFAAMSSGLQILEPEVPVPGKVLGLYEWDGVSDPALVYTWASSGHDDVFAAAAFEDQRIGVVGSTGTDLLGATRTLGFQEHQQNGFFSVINLE